MGVQATAGIFTENMEQAAQVKEGQSINAPYVREKEYIRLLLWVMTGEAGLVLILASIREGVTDAALPRMKTIPLEDGMQAEPEGIKELVLPVVILRKRLFPSRQIQMAGLRDIRL